MLKKDKNLRFHRSPKKKELRERSIAKIRRNEGYYFAIIENTHVYSKHFCDEDYTVSKMEKVRNLSDEKSCSNYF